MRAHVYSWVFGPSYRQTRTILFLRGEALDGCFGNWRLQIALLWGRGNTYMYAFMTFLFSGGVRDKVVAIGLTICSGGRAR